MKLTVESTALADAVSWASRIIDSRPILPALSGLKLETGEGTLKLSSFNTEISSRLEIPATIEEAGTVLVKAKVLADITHSLSSDAQVSITSTDDRFTLTCNKSKFTLQCMSLSMYPELPQVPSTFGQVDAQTFVQAITQTSIASMKDYAIPLLSGIHIICKADKVTLLATDRQRLAQSTFTWSSGEDTDISFILRGTILRDLARTFNQQHNVSLGFNPEQPTIVGVENDLHTSTIQIIDGEYPCLDPLLDVTYDIQAVLDRQACIDAIKRVCLVGERNAIVRFNLTEKELTLSVGRSEEAYAQESLDIDLDGEPITISFKSSFLLDGLQSISEPYVRMKLNAPLKPVEFNGQQEIDGDESLDYRYIMVPAQFD